MMVQTRWIEAPMPLAHPLRATVPQRRDEDLKDLP